MGRVHPSGRKERQRHFCWWRKIFTGWKTANLLGVLSRLEVWCAAAGGASGDGGDGGGGGADGAGGERVTFPAAEKDRDTAPA